MRSFPRSLQRIFFLLVIFSLIFSACSLPEQMTTPQPAATPTIAPQTLPPAIVETTPLKGSRIGLQEAITLYFNQPMDRVSVEAAWVTEPSITGDFDWQDDATLTFTPRQPVEAEASLRLGVSTAARAANGIAFEEPVTLHYATADHLRPTQFLPEAGTVDVRVDSAVVAAFNQPIVSLGADADSLPAAFTLQPAAEGRGEWLNSSAYIFYPEPALAGGETYIAVLNETLVSAAGTPLAQGNGAVAAWSFTTAKPRLLEITPSTELALPLDLTLTLTFNQPMDAESVETNFSLSGPEGALAGNYAWNEDLTVFTFEPDGLLARNTDYQLNLAGAAQARGGTPLNTDWQVELRSSPNFYKLETTPLEGGVTTEYGGAKFVFTTPVDDENLDDLVTIEPEAPNFGLNTNGNELYAYGTFEPETQYTLTVSPDLQDIWGQRLGDLLTLRFSAPYAKPRLMFPYLGSDIYFTPADKPSFYIQATNIFAVDMTLGEVPLADFFRLFGPDGYNERKDYLPPEPVVWRQSLEVERNKSETLALPLANAGQELTPGVYYLRVLGVDDERTNYPVYLISSNYNLVFKVSATDALVWATDLRTNVPLQDATVLIYGESGALLASGQTDAAGLWHAPIVPQKDYYGAYYAVIGQPGEEGFAFAASSWGQDIAPWRFGLSMDRRPPHTEVYLYTDRPIYRPGQTVYFRAIVRQAYDGRYSDSGLSNLPLNINDSWGDTIRFVDLPLSAYGTAHGSFTLAEDARPGYYSFSNDEIEFGASFQVAEYRKPEINLSMEMTPDEVKNGQPLTAEISARYFFDAPTSDLPVQWALYDQSSWFSLPGYRVGELSLGWLRGYYGDDFGYYGESIAEGEAVTDADGKLTLNLSDLDVEKGTRELTLEITAQDESGQQISARTTAALHPDDFYIGLRPDLWVGREETEMGFDILTVDWNADPSAARSLHADFQQVTWERQDSDNPYGSPTFIPIYTPVSDVDFVTGADGAARLSFTPPQPGTYVLDVSGGDARSQILLWVRGAEQAVWPNLPNNHLRLTADRDAYHPGDIAEIFIPNPLDAATQALITVERGTVHSSQIIPIEAGGSIFSLPLTDEDAPTVYVSAALLGGREFRVGYAKLDVAPDAQVLNVTLTSQPTRSQPGGEVNFGVQVTDAAGNPVQGEFSLAVVDLAALALADPNSEDIVSAFYSEEKIGVKTSLSMAADSVYGVFLDGGLGGGGGGGGDVISVSREDFPDTAYWNGEIVTDATGRAQVSVILPDNLTTWQVDLRGLTMDTRVGSAEMQVVSTKDVLIRPVTPRFMVVGDHVEMAAIVHNNTADDLQGTVTLQAIGFLLDDPALIEQQVSIPAGGRTRVAWWGTAQDAETAELIFDSQFGDHQDMTRPIWGSLPILRYTSPQSFVTAGVLPEAGSKLEVISLPRSFVPTGGRLDVELAPSLAAAILDSLEAMPVPTHTSSNEAVLSYLLPNLETYRALQAAGLDNPDLKERLDASLDESVSRLAARQNEDNGWGWWAEGKSHPYISTYILFGLWRARELGVYVDETMIIAAREYLTAARPYSGSETLAVWQMDRLAFIEYVMQMTGGAEAESVEKLYEWRDQISPWAQALLALTLEDRTAGDARAKDLLSNLQSSAIRSASGAHWESDAESWRNPGTPNYTTATIIYVLAQRDPANPILADAVRYLASHRNVHGYWGSSYESAWSLLALTEVMKGAGELNANFTFNADLNGTIIAEGQTSGPETLTPIVSSAPLDGLQLAVPNALTISREAGIGRLYYRAALLVNRPAETAPPLDQGFEISRSFIDADCEENCASLDSTQLMTGAKLQVQLTLNVPHDSYFVMVEDFIPSGTEILNQRLKTSQQGEQATDASVYDPDDPFAKGWGWWLFDEPQIHDDHIQWAADYLPAGTYVLTYTLTPLQAGEYRVLPAHAWQAYFPEVQGTSAGEIFEISP